MAIQLLFCVEADRRSRTDWIYIRSVIDKYYKMDNSISIKPIYMGGKTNYKRNKVVNEITTASKEFKNTGSTIVIYCIDTDDWNTNPDRNRELNEVVAYCESKKHNLIWFCRDVEEVFWGKRIVASDKKDYAKRFKNGNRLDLVPSNNIRDVEMNMGKSNILVILEQYLNRQVECSS